MPSWSMLIIDIDQNPFIRRKVKKEKENLRFDIHIHNKL